MDDGTIARRRVDPRKKRKQLRKQRDDSIKDFCRTILQIARAMHTKNKQDLDLSELYEQLKIGIKDTPMDVFEPAGEYVWDNRVHIGKGDMKKFMKRDYTKDIKEGLAKDDIRDSSEVEKVQLLITKIKRTWRLFNSVEQGDKTKKLQNLLKQRAIWMHSVKALKKMDKE